MASLESTDSKRRLNFLKGLRGASSAYGINEVAQAYGQQQGLSQQAWQQLSQGPLSLAETRRPGQRS